MLLFLSVIRAKLVGAQEVDVGNDIYGNPIKRIKYDIKQIKVHGIKLSISYCGKKQKKLKQNIIPI